MNKDIKIGWLVSLLAAMVLGAWLGKIYERKHCPSRCPSRVAHSGQQAVLPDLRGAELPQGMEEFDQSQMHSAEEIPSQLVPINLPNVKSVEKPSLPGEESAAWVPSSAPSPIVLQQGRQTVVPLPSTPVNSVDGEETKITMIEAPVKLKTIKTLEEYKTFKRSAKGKYPDVDFSKNMVLVLESDSNLPDNMFEIVDVQAHDDDLLLTYRVSIIGLHEKTNTHSVKWVKKSNKKVVLKQVL